MRICFISENSIEAFLREYERGSGCRREELRADLFAFGFGGMGEVSYERELKGDTAYFEAVARLSRLSQSVVVCGGVTDARGHKRKSAVVVENGKVLGISDALHAIDGEMASGAALRVYETAIGRMGVAVADDLRFPEVMKALSVCGSDFIVCPHERADEMQRVLLRAHAYCYGIPIYFCAKGYSMIADASGGVPFSSPQSPVYAEFFDKKEYHLVETRRRGIYRSK